ncbi:acyl-CoA dehydrogenase family protein [Haliea salexigens]|uniref:acyl-CoA dehydrogenase family protein n=1 Tax=Haliea salexigens TaxID=287487 RepID=UPI000414F544|nr:acyl-CoA dehydrogenase family protein [Haliea salexigens]|tara:strand:- start:27309 stop:28415 length:1107 start_codon:yes stop_codon:yes gene_type:complete
MSEHMEALVMIRDQGRRLLEQAATPERQRALLDQPGAFDRDLWDQVVELGWPGAGLAEAQGGLGLGWSAVAELHQLLGARAASLPLLQTCLAVDLLVQADADQARHSEALAAGAAIACVSLFGPGEPGLPERPLATLTDGLLSGSSTAVAFAAVADIALVYAWDSGAGSPVWVVLETSATGVARSTPNVIDNARAMAVLTFENAHCSVLSIKDPVAAARRLAAAAAVITAFEQIGGMETCLHDACDYARERRVFAQPIGAFQAIKHGLADIYADLEVARGCAIDALAKLENASPQLPAFAAAARIGATAAYEHAARENIQFHGGIGVTWESTEHFYFRRSRSLALEWGSLPYWRELLVDNAAMLTEGY